MDKGRFGSVLKHRYNTVRGERGQAVIKTERQGDEARPGNSTEEWTLWRTGKNKFTEPKLWMVHFFFKNVYPLLELFALGFLIA